MVDGSHHTEDIWPATPLMQSTTLPAPWTAPTCPESLPDTGVNGERHPGSGSSGRTVVQDRLERLDGLFDHPSDAPGLPVRDTPILSLSLERLLRHPANISQWLGVVKPDPMRQGSPHEPLASDAIAWATLVLTASAQPGQCLLPHGIILRLCGWLRIFMEAHP